jgi:RNA recognition motif-containing protein
MVIYIGNLSVETSEHDLIERFKLYGPVTSVNIMRDEVSGDALGFAFVKMNNRRAAYQATAGLNKTRIGNRIVMVCETSARLERRCPTSKPAAAMHKTSKC